MFWGSHGKIRNEYFALALAGSYWIVLSWASLIGKSRQWPMKVCKTRSWFQHISMHSYFCDLFWDWLTLTSWYFHVFSDWWTWPTKNYRVCDLVLFQKRRAASQRKNNRIACNYLLVHISPNILYIYMAHCETVKHKLEAKISDFNAEMWRHTFAAAAGIPSLWHQPRDTTPVIDTAWAVGKHGQNWRWVWATAFASTDLSIMLHCNPLFGRMEAYGFLPPSHLHGNAWDF